MNYLIFHNTVLCGQNTRYLPSGFSDSRAGSRANSRGGAATSRGAEPGRDGGALGGASAGIGATEPPPGLPKPPPAAAPLASKKSVAPFANDGAGAKTVR